jgi:hypothetical protein
MPQATTKNRQDLRSRFASHAIPTEEDFTDLITAGLNQADAGLLKLADQSLGVVRQKAEAPVLRFFADPVAESSAWQLQLLGTDKLSLGLSGPAGSTALCLDGATGNVGIGTTAASHRLTVEAPWSDRQAPGGKLSKQGALAIRSTAPQLDLLTPEATAQDWAIQVKNNKLAFIRSPWEASNLVLDGGGNVGIGTDTPSQRLHVAGSMQVEADLAVGGNLEVTGRVSGEIRNVWYATGSSWVPYNEGRVVSRSLIVEKKYADTVLRILYSDNTKVSGNAHNPRASARWEIRLARMDTSRSNWEAQVIDGSVLTKPIRMDRYDASSSNFYVHSTVVGYVESQPAGTYQIQVWVCRIPEHPFEINHVGTGGLSSAWCLESEEVYQNNLQE